MFHHCVEDSHLASKTHLFYASHAILAIAQGSFESDIGHLDGEAWQIILRDGYSLDSAGAMRPEDLREQEVIVKYRENILVF
jgi:hypothetical protein